MPLDKTHRTIGVTISAATVLIGSYIGYPLESISIAAGILLGDTLFSPDLDLGEVHTKPFQRWGFLRWVWIPYARTISHRSFLSHSGPFSATLRVIYFLIFLLPFLYVMGLDNTWYFVVQYHYWLMMLWIGLMISDTVHTTADYL